MKFIQFRKAILFYKIAFFSIFQIEGQNLIVSPKGNFNCIITELSGFSGTLNHSCSNQVDSNSFPFPWCELSDIDYIGSCKNGKIDEFHFEFSFEPLLNSVQFPYIQGKLCHELIQEIQYEFGFTIRCLNSSNLRFAKLFINFSDTILTKHELQQLSESDNYTRLDNILKVEKTACFKKKFLSKGNEKYFQIWITFPENKVKHLFIHDWYLTSITDTICRQIFTDTRLASKTTQSMFDTFNLKNEVYFGMGEFTLNSAGKEQLDNFISNLLLHKSIKNITIVGYTDSIGAESYNKKLSLNRAKSIRDYLIQKGIQPLEWVVKGLGEQSMKYVSNSTLFLNRRVEIIIEY